MGITNEELNLLEIFSDIGNVCHTEAHCGTCAAGGCLVGYSKECLSSCRVGKKTFVVDGMKNIPPDDIRGGYDEYDVLHAIAHLLCQCRSCKAEHFEDCIINIVRSCMEVIEFGEEQEYTGDPLSYLMKVSGINSEKGAVILQEYKRWKAEKKGGF